MIEHGFYNSKKIRSLCTILLYIICSHVYPFSYLAADQGRETFALSKYLVLPFYVVARQFTNLKYHPNISVTDIKQIADAVQTTCYSDVLVSVLFYPFYVIFTLRFSNDPFLHTLL